MSKVIKVNVTPTHPDVESGVTLAHSVIEAINNDPVLSYDELVVEIHGIYTADPDDNSKLINKSFNNFNVGGSFNIQ